MRSDLPTSGTAFVEMISWEWANWQHEETGFRGLERRFEMQHTGNSSTAHLERSNTTRGFEDVSLLDITLNIAYLENGLEESRSMPYAANWLIQVCYA